jgi:pumilio RNA-binding family
MFAADNMKTAGTHFYPFYACAMPVPATQPIQMAVIPSDHMNSMQPAVFQPMDMWGQTAGWNQCAYPCLSQPAIGQMVIVEMPLVQPESVPTPVEQNGVENYIPNGPMSVRGAVWKLSKDPSGCRAVQQAFDEAECDADRVTLAAELHTHVWDALKCANANHVLQKCISTMRPVDSQFIISELQQAGPGAVARAARHRYGCRVLQRLFEHCPPNQLHAIAEDLLLDAVALCSHLFAKYVMQHLLEHGTEDQINRLTEILAANARSLGEDGAGCAVIGKALEHASPSSQAALVQALLQQPGLLADMACSRHGHLAAKLALQLAETPHKWEALNELVGQHEKLKASRYGRVLNVFVQKCMEEQQ